MIGEYPNRIGFGCFEESEGQGTGLLRTAGRELTIGSRLNTVTCVSNVVFVMNLAASMRADIFVPIF